MKSTNEYLTLLRQYMDSHAGKYGIVRMGIFGSVAVVSKQKIAMWIFVLKPPLPIYSH